MEVNRLIEALCLEGYSPSSPPSTENSSERSPSPEPTPSYLGNEIRQQLLKKGIIDENGYIIDLNKLPPLPSCLPQKCIKRAECLLDNYKKMYTPITKNDRKIIEKLTGKKLPNIDKYQAEINYLRTLKTISKECGSTHLELRGSACLYVLAPLIKELLKCKTPFNKFPKDTDLLFKGSFTNKALQETHLATLANVVVNEPLDDALLYALKKQTLFPKEQTIFRSQKSASTTFSIGKLDVTLAHGPLKRTHLFAKDDLRLPLDDLLTAKFGDTAFIPIPKDQHLTIWQAIIDYLTQTIHVDQPKTINTAGVLRLFYLLSLDWKYLDKTALPVLLKRVPFSKMENFDAKIEQILHDHKDYTASGKVAVLLNLLSTVRPSTKNLSSMTIPATRRKNEHPFLVQIGNLLKNNRLSYQAIESLVTYLTLCESPKLKHTFVQENIELHLDQYRWSFPYHLVKSLNHLQNCDPTAQQALLPLLLEYNPLQPLSTPIPNALHHAIKCQRSGSPLLHIIGLQIMLTLNKPEQLLHYYIEHKPKLEKIKGTSPLLRNAYEELLKTYPWLKGEHDYHEVAISKVKDPQLAFSLYQLLPLEKQEKQQNQIFQRLLSKGKTDRQQAINLLKLIQTMPPQSDLDPRELKWIGEQAILYDEDQSIWFWLKKSLPLNSYILNDLCLYSITEKKYHTAIALNQHIHNPTTQDLLQKGLLQNNLELAKDFSQNNPSFAKIILQKECISLKAKPLLEKLDQPYCEQLDPNYLSKIRKNCLKKLPIEKARQQASRLIEQDKLTPNDIEEITAYLLDKISETEWNHFLSPKLQYGQCPLPLLRRLLETDADKNALHRAILHLPPSTEVAETLLTLSPDPALLKQKLPGLVNKLLEEDQTETLFTLLTTFPTHLDDNDLLEKALQYIFERTDQWERFGQLIIKLNINPNSPFLQTSQVGIKEIIKKCQKQPLTCLRLLQKHQIDDRELWETNLNRLFPSPSIEALPLLLHADTLGYMSFTKWEKTLKILPAEKLEQLLDKAKLSRKDPAKFLEAHLKFGTKDLERIKPLLEQHLNSSQRIKPEILKQLIPIADEEILTTIQAALLVKTDWSNNLIKKVVPPLFHRWINLEIFPKADELINAPHIAQALPQYNALKLKLSEHTANDSTEDQIQLLCDHLEADQDSSQSKSMLQKVSNILIDAFFNESVPFFSRNYLRILQAIHPEDKKWINDERNSLTHPTQNSKAGCLELSAKIHTVNSNRYAREQRRKDLSARRLHPLIIDFTITLYHKLITKQLASDAQIIPTLTEAQKLLCPLFKGAYYSHKDKLFNMLDAFVYYDIPPHQTEIERIKMYKGIFCILKSTEVDLFISRMKWFDQINLHAFVHIPCTDKDDFNRLWNSCQITLPTLTKKKHHIDLHRAVFIMQQIMNNSLEFTKESTLEISRTFLETYMPDIINSMTKLDYTDTIQNEILGVVQEPTIPIFSVIRSFLLESPCFRNPGSSKDKEVARRTFLLLMKGLNKMINHPPKDATPTRILGEMALAMQQLNQDLYSDATDEYTEIAQEFFDRYAELHGQKKNVTLFNLIYKGEDLPEDTTTKYKTFQLVTSARIMTIVGDNIKEENQQLLVETGIKPLIKALSRLGSVDLQQFIPGRDIYSIMHAMLLSNPIFVKKDKTLKEHAIFQEVVSLYIKQLQNTVKNRMPNTTPNFLVGQMVKFIRTAYCKSAFDGNYKGYLAITAQFIEWYFNTLDEEGPNFIDVDNHTQDYFFTSVRIRGDDNTIVWPLTTQERIMRSNTFYNYLAFLNGKNIDGRYTQILKESYAFAKRMGIFTNTVFYLNNPFLLTNIL